MSQDIFCRHMGRILGPKEVCKVCEWDVKDALQSACEHANYRDGMVSCPDCHMNHLLMKPKGKKPEVNDLLVNALIFIAEKNLVDEWIIFNRERLKKEGFTWEPKDEKPEETPYKRP